MKNKNDGICRIVSAGTFSAEEFSKRLKKENSSLLIAADAGYLHLEKLGIIPDLFVGDADSLGFMPENTEIVALPAEKDDTDTMAAVKKGLNLGFSRFELFASLGGKRFSHSLANLQTLLFLKENGADGELIDENCTVKVLRNETAKIENAKFISVFAASEEATVSERGVKYPLENHRIINCFPLGVSNEPADGVCEIEVTSGVVFLVIEK